MFYIKALKFFNLQGAQRLDRTQRRNVAKGSIHSPQWSTNESAFYDGIVSDILRWISEHTQILHWILEDFDHFLHNMAVFVSLSLSIEISVYMVDRIHH